MDVTFHPGIPTTLGRKYFPWEQRSSLLVLGDLMRETVKSDQVKAHHLNLFVIVVTQNLYASGKHSVGMNPKYQYKILFRNPANTCCIKTLWQGWMGDAKCFMLLYELSHDTLSFITFSVCWLFVDKHHILAICPLM